MSVFILENIKKSFTVDKNEHVVLNDINLIFPDKGFVSIIGKSGSGKSTLLNILMGIEKPTSGKVLFKGRNISKFNDKHFSNFHLNGVSTVFQHYNLFNELSVIENIILPLQMKGLRKRKSRHIGVSFLEKFGLQNLGKQKAKSLSGGEKQRVAIIRSLVTDPEVVLCDEPTGALDEKNSREIMGILKEISKNKLVIMVSHNQELVDEFSDFKIRLKDGHVVENNIQLEHQQIKVNKKEKKSYKTGWILTFLKENLKRDLGKNIFSLIACSFGFASVFLCTGFLVGSETSHKEALTKNLSIGNATVSKIEAIEITDSPLTYQKNIRPELSEVDKEFEEFTTIRVEENLSYFLSSYVSCLYLDNTFTNFQLVPIYDLSLKSYGSDLLIAGHGGGDNFEEVVVNEEFAKLIGIETVNKVIVLKNSASTNYKTYNDDYPFVKDELLIEKPMKIVGIIKEFPFLNTPKVYYSYKGGQTFLRNQFMENLSYYFGYPYTFMDYILDCDEDDEASSYSSYLFLTDLSESDKFFEKIKNLNDQTLEVTSTVLEIKETYITFISSFSKTLFVFSIIAFVGINFILGMISLSSFLRNRKNAAIMTCLGARNSSIYNLHLLENYIVIAVSFWLSLFLSNLGQKLINPCISNKFALTNLITIPFGSLFNIRFGLIILFSIIVVLCSALFTLIPMSIYRHGYITDELRDE